MYGSPEEFREVQPDHTARDLSDVLAWVRRGKCEMEQLKDGYCRECYGRLFGSTSAGGAPDALSPVRICLAVFACP